MKIQFRPCTPVSSSTYDFYVKLELFFFQVKRTIDAHLDIYTITAGQPSTCVKILLRNICHFPVISRDLSSEKTAMQTLINQYSLKHGECFSCHQNKMCPVIIRAKPIMPPRRWNILVCPHRSRCIHKLTL